MVAVPLSPPPLLLLLLVPDWLPDWLALSSAIAESMLSVLNDTGTLLPPLDAGSRTGIWGPDDREKIEPP